MRDFESVDPAGPGAPVLNIYVVEPMSMDEAKAAIVDSYGIRPLASGQRPVNMIHTGPIDAFAHRHRERPAPCGFSVAGSPTSATRSRSAAIAGCSARVAIRAR